MRGAAIIRYFCTTWNQLRQLGLGGTKVNKLIVLLMVLAVAFVALPVGAQSLPYIDLNADGPPHVSGAPIPIPPDDTETFWAHIGWAGHEGEVLHIAEVSWRWWADPQDGAVSLIEEWYIQPSQEVVVSTWFPWIKVRTMGRPCTSVFFQADVAFHDATGQLHGPLWSNIVEKHVVPEPGALFALGTGLVGMAGAFWRRRIS